MLGKPADRSTLSIACLVEGYPQAFIGDALQLGHGNDHGLFLVADSGNRGGWNKRDLPAQAIWGEGGREGEIRGTTP